MKNLDSFLVTASRVLLFAVALMIAPGNNIAKAQAFRAGCGELPSQIGKLKHRHPIDATCRRVAGNNPAGRLQNTAKNNFCASGTPIPITRDTLLRLQEAIDQSGLVFGRDAQGEHLPPTRDPLKNLTINDNGRSRTLSEGDAVTIVGFINDARHSNTNVAVSRTTGKCTVKGGESVNCGLLGCENNDIHIDLGDAAEVDACSGFTAEISPHLRPLVWDKITSESYKADFKRFPVRMTGQLFFDGSHRPCRNGVGAAPKRAASWEVHPVYAIDVCRIDDISRCKIDDESVWLPFHLGLGLRPAVTEKKCASCGK
jgi:hypothetical protein